MLRIMMIEDNPSDRERNERMLERLPGDIVTTSYDTLKIGMTKVVMDKPDCVLLDLHLPDSEPENTLRVFRVRYPHIPVVVVTSQEIDPLLVLAQEMGYDAYYIKQSPPEILVRSIEKAVRAARYEDQGNAILEELRAIKEQLAKI